MKTVKIAISKQGKVSIDVEGVTDSSCRDLTAAIENALGTVTSTIDKDLHEVHTEEQVKSWQ